MRRRILFYVNQIYLDEPSGQASIERGLIAALRKRTRQEPGAEIRVFSIRRPGDPREKGVEGPNDRSLLLGKSRYWDHLGYQWRLFRLLAKEFLRCRDAHASLYVRYHPNLVCVALLALLFRRRLVFRTGPVFPSMRIYRPDVKKWAYPLIGVGFKFLCWKAHAIIVITRRVAAWVAEFCPFASHKIKIVPNGVAPEKFFPVAPEREKWGLGKADFVFGYVGFIDDDQGLHVLIRALADVRKRPGRTAHLLAVGDGPSRAKWEELALSLGVSDSVVWAGSRPHDEIPSAIAACDVMLLPLTRHSIEVRGTSATKLFEYLACDKFVLASRCDDLTFLEENEVGQLVEPEDVDAWAGAMWNQMNGGRGGLRGRGRRLVMREYTFERMAGKIWDACFG